MQKRREGRSGVGDPGYVPRLEVSALLEGECPQPALDIGKPHAIGTADGHCSVAGDAPDPRGERGITRRVLERTGEHDDAPRAAPGRSRHLLLQTMVANPEQHEVGYERHRFERRVADDALDLVVVRVDRSHLT